MAASKAQDTKTRFLTKADLWNLDEAKIDWTDKIGARGLVGYDMEYTPKDEAPLDLDANLRKEGAYGSVHKVTCRNKRRQVAAVKQIPLKEHKNNLSKCQDEVDHHRRCPHYHIVQAFGSYIRRDSDNRRSFYLLLFPLADCDLSEYLDSPQSFHKYGKPGSVLPQFFGCLAAALRHIHDNNMKHLDLKPANIVIAPGRRVMITDFSVSLYFQDGKSTTSDPVHTTPMVRSPMPRQFKLIPSSINHQK